MQPLIPDSRSSAWIEQPSAGVEVAARLARRPWRRRSRASARTAGPRSTARRSAPQSGLEGGVDVAHGITVPGHGYRRRASRHASRRPHLNDGTTIPAIGFGTSGLTGEDGVTRGHSAPWRTATGCIDTAVNYGNEARGRRGDPPLRRAARRDRGDQQDPGPPPRVRRRDRQHPRVAGAAGPRPASTCTSSTGPTRSQDQYVEAWRALVAAARRGAGPLPRRLELHRGPPASGSSTETGVTPVLNQIELHPYFPQAELRAVHERLGIVTESWSPLAAQAAPSSTEPVVADAARAHGVTPGQVVLRWHLQLGTLPIPKSATPERQRAEPRPRRVRAQRRRDGRDHRRWAARTAAGSAATPTSTRSVSVLRPCPRSHARRTCASTSTRLRRNVRRAADLASADRVRAAPARQDPQVAGDRRLQLGSGAVGLTVATHRRGRGVRARTAAPTCSSPTPSVARRVLGRGPAARPGRARPGSRSASTRSTAPPAPGGHLAAVRRRGGRRGRQRPAPHAAAEPQDAGAVADGRRARRAAGARGLHLPRPQLRRRTRPRRPREEAEALRGADGLARGRRARGARGQRRLHPEPGRTPTSAWSPRLRPGVYVFGDAQQWELGTMPPRRHRAHLRATVVSHAGGRVVLDAGSKALGADRAAYGTGWGRLPRAPGRADRAALRAPRRRRASPTRTLPPLGSQVDVVPNHCCAAVNLHDELWVEEHGRPAPLAGRRPGPQRLSAGYDRPHARRRAQAPPRRPAPLSLRSARSPRCGDDEPSESAGSSDSGEASTSPSESATAAGACD